MFTIFDGANIVCQGYDSMATFEQYRVMKPSIGWMHIKDYFDPRVEKPTGVARFPGERAFWPRSYAERAYNLVRWSDLPAGGHFAAMEQPGLFVDELRAFRRQLATA